MLVGLLVKRTKITNEHALSQMNNIVFKFYPDVYFSQYRGGGHERRQYGAGFNLCVIYGFYCFSAGVGCFRSMGDRSEKAL